MSWLKQRFPRPHALQIPLLAFLVVSAFSVLLGYTLLQHSRNEIKRESALVAASVANEVSSQLSARTLALVRMAWRLEVMGSPPAEEWETDAQLYLRGFSGLQGVVWMTPSLEVKSSAVREGQTAALDWASGLSESQRAAAVEARQSRNARATSTFLLPDGGRAFLVFVPVGGAENDQGFLVGVYRVHELFADTLGENIAAGYEVVILENGVSLYQRGAAGEAPAALSVQEQAVLVFGANWRVRVWPEPTLYAQRRTMLPEVVMVAGILMGVLVGSALFYSREAQLRAQEAVEAHSRLKSEVKLRELAEEGFRQQAQILTQLEDALLSTDLHGYVTSWNRGARRLFGFHAEEVLGKHLPFISKAEDAELLSRHLLAPLQAKGRHEAALRFVHKSGEEFVARVSLSLLRDDSGTDAGVIFTIRNSERSP
ncbi:MAG: PAS domain S-box protein [Acidobacteria bacterium]|nr:PAS domain S-box protein [Acidobacteriota bacterium]